MPQVLRQIEPVLLQVLSWVMPITAVLGALLMMLLKIMITLRPVMYVVPL